MGRALGQIFSYGISIVNSTDAPTEPIARSSVEDSYQQIIGDLQTAIGLFNTYNGNQYASEAAAKALLARVYLYHGDLSAASDMATEVISDSNFDLFGPDDFTKIYTEKLTQESVFELVFDPQNTSAYNSATYLRDDALRSDVILYCKRRSQYFFRKQARRQEQFPSRLRKQ